MPKVIHLIPYVGIGGVETAARSMAGHTINSSEFQIDFIYPPDNSQQSRYALFHPLPVLQAARRIVAEKPDLLIVLLWRSFIVALLAKLLRPRLPLVLFPHTPGDMHWLDRFATRAVAARFVVIGPDGCYLAQFKAMVTAYGLTEAVHLKGSLDFEAISHHASTASLYLQKSCAEGMAMSVVEAMQFGLVPVVTPVGEIGNYCQHNMNALLVKTNETAIDDITELLHDDARFQSLSKNAAATWADHPLYAESMLQACMNFLTPFPNKDA